MRILTAAEMGEADRRSAEEFGVSLAALMERAGEAVARFCGRLYPGVTRVLVVCGKGNNGGDGLVAARYLAKMGVEARVFLLGRAEDCKGEVAENLDRLRREANAVEVIEVGEGTAQTLVGDGLGWAELVVDAVVGTGFKPPLRGLALVVRDALNVAMMPVVAVDVPSGWDADAVTQHADGSTGEAAEGTFGGAFRADAVVTFTAPKQAHVFGHLTPGVTFGPVAVAEIGTPEGAVASELNLTWTGVSKEIARRPRNINSNKGKFGHVLLVGGSYGKAGAPSMSSLAGLRTGAGLLTAAVPRAC